MLEGASKKVQVNHKQKVDPTVKTQEPPKTSEKFNTPTAIFPIDKLYVATKPAPVIMTSINFAEEPNNDSNTVKELKRIGGKYMVFFEPGEDIEAYQKKVVK